MKSGQSWFHNYMTKVVLFMLLLNVNGLELQQIVFPNSEAECKSCCTSAFDSSYDLDFCLVQGCEADVNLAGDVVEGQINFGFECGNVNSDVGGSDRRGCELGRDFRLLGSSEVVGSSVLHCNNGILSPSPPDITYPPTDQSVSSSDCKECCATLDDNFDKNRENFPFANDFARAFCEEGCEIAFDNTCENFLNLDEHRQRLGCALGIDMFQLGKSILRDSAIACDSSGNLFVSTFSPTTDQPTISPTTRPIVSPTQDPTKSPTKANENERGGQEALIIGSVSAGILATFALFTLFRRYKRRELEKVILYPETGNTSARTSSWMSKLYDLRSKKVRPSGITASAQPGHGFIDYSNRPSTLQTDALYQNYSGDSTAFETKTTSGFEY